jgi:outer membrane translocation and assembly module TamA
LIVPGKPYNLEEIKNERIRIDTRLKNRGYYFFNADYIIDIVDTTVGNNEVDMYFKLKPTTPRADIAVYKINNIWVYPTYSLQDDSMLGEAPAIPYEDYFVIDPEEKFKPQTFHGMLLFHKGQPYSRRAHNQSLNRLVSIGNFKFVKAKFEEVDTVGHYLDPYFFMTPLPKRSAKLEVSGLTKTNNAVGTEVSVNWTNRNVFRGAEQLTAGVFGGFETQVYQGETISISRAGVEAKLTFPRVVAPFRLNTTSDFVPKTRINARYEFYDRTKQYTLNSISGSYGFIWKTDIRIEHQLNVLNLNFVQPVNIDPNFQAALDTDVTLARTIEPQFILGPSYNFNYNSNARANRRMHNFYFNGNIEAPGNILGVIAGTEFNKEKQGSGKFLNTPFSQYLRVETDFRYYMTLGDKTAKTTVWANRLLAGVGLPYGNSEEMPFIKAFFAGGVSDIRAFRARSLGPGTYTGRNSEEVNYTVPPDQPGDIKLLASTELRAKLVSILHGAAFVDAGNIWTVKEDTARPGAKFTPNFLIQVAVGAGLGLRLDLTFLIVRFDLAIPVVKPYAVTGKDFDWGNKEWRRDNLILNFALGYPF